MKHKGIVIAFAAISLVTVAIGAFAQAASHKAHVSARSAVWSPEPYVSGRNLPPGFKGIEIKEVWNVLKSKQEVLQKGKYETTAEYKQRLTASSSSIAPLIPSDEYGFLLQDIRPTYDADTQAFSAWKPIWCQKTLDYGQNKGWFTCVVGKLSRQESNYVGSNAFGVNATISKTTGTDFGIAIPQDNKFFESDIFSHGPYSRNAPMHELKASFAVPINEARALKNLTIGVLLVGRFDSARLIEGHPTMLSPTIDAPYDTFVTQDAVPFTPTKLVLYVEETGVILGVKEL